MKTAHHTYYYLDGDSFVETKSGIELSYPDVVIIMNDAKKLEWRIKRAMDVMKKMDTIGYGILIAAVTDALEGR